MQNWSWLYTEDLNTESGKELLKLMKDTGVVIEFQLTSNVRLNNLSDLKNHPIKIFLKNGIKCVQGTDGGECMAQTHLMNN